MRWMPKTAGKTTGKALLNLMLTGARPSSTVHIRQERQLRHARLLRSVQKCEKHHYLLFDEINTQK